ncbi:MAG: 3-phosphoserine/phosphohydroxythreonine transaminase, partial [Betaproteobacteria bacterium]|nr:3-phosphoserine/phosphohydroxythreonine transaminase [Betaproteobacteria bacterium]
TGEWSKKAIKEAGRYCTVNVAASSADANFSYAPEQSAWRLDPEAAYVHYTPNETIGGVEFHWVPETGSVPLVADMSSNILSRPIDVARYGLIYAGAQKNIGPAGLTLVIVREDLIGETLPGTPTMFDYKVHADNDSMYNTPPTYAIYIAGLVFQWLSRNGGLEQMLKVNAQKAALLYQYLDRSGFYHCPTSKLNRSLMNVPFTLKDSALDGEFLQQAKSRGLVQLKGHRSVGGMRASIYNAMPMEGVQALVDFMGEFEKKHG